VYFTKVLIKVIDKQDRQCMYNITLKRIHATSVAVEKQ